MTNLELLLTPLRKDLSYLADLADGLGVPFDQVVTLVLTELRSQVQERNEQVEKTAEIFDQIECLLETITRIHNLRRERIIGGELHGQASQSSHTSH